MRFLIFVPLLVGQVLAQRIEVPPLEFQPLTSLPWKEKPDAALPEHLRRLFLEPDPAIRYPVLAAYLRQIPIKDLEAAFDLCVTLEGTQCPKELVAFFLPIWAERDPQNAWKRTEPMFGLQDTDWLGHDSWSEVKIAFRNLDAMRQSTFWLDPRWLENFLAGLNRSTLDEAGKNALRSAFRAKWSPICASAPSEHPTGGYEHESKGLLDAFDVPVDGIREKLLLAVSEKQAAALQILLRRWLVAKPDKAALIASLAEKLKADTSELFLLWLHQAPETFIEWVDAHTALPEPPLRLMGMVMSRVTGQMRDRWLKLIQARDTEGGMFASLIYEWAAWDHERAMSTAIASKSVEAISHAASGIIYGGFNRHGLSYIRDFDLSRLPLKDIPAVFEEWTTIMEQWGDLDIGEAARYGLDFMLRTNYTPRENLLKLFAGDDAFGSDSDMIDRTFCALRMWAALKPAEMKTWIASLPDAEMRKALTWLLEHPWGHLAKP